MNKQDSVLTGQLVTGNFSIQAQLPKSDKNITISGYLYEGESVESVNSRIDLIHDVVDRQLTRISIARLDAEHSQFILHLSQIKSILGELESKQSSGQKLSSQEKNNLVTMNQNVTMLLSNLAAKAAEIAEARAKLV